MHFLFHLTDATLWHITNCLMLDTRRFPTLTLIIIATVVVGGDGEGVMDLISCESPRQRFHILYPIANKTHCMHALMLLSVVDLK